MADNQEERHAEREAKRRPGDGSHTWLGLLVVIACAVACGVAIVLAARRWAPL